MFTNNLALAIFFLYFVLMSGQTYELMNCGLQRTIDNAVYLKHIMVFLSIFLFTYILNWYTLDHINEVALPTQLFATAKNIEKYEDKEVKDEKVDKSVEKANRIKYIIKSVLYSFLIYVIFVMSSKNEGVYSNIFLISICVVVLATIFKTTLDKDVVNSVGSDGILTVVTPGQITKLQEKHPDTPGDVVQLAVIQNGITFVSVITVVFLCIGMYKYYLRQYSDHYMHWSWFKFIFGTSKCASIQ